MTLRYAIRGALLVASAVTACAAFEAEPEGDASPDAGADSSGPSNVDGSSVPPDACEGTRCPLFHDDFERVDSDVRGPWTRADTSPNGRLSFAPTAAGSRALEARTPGGSLASPTHAFLEARFPNQRGLEIRASIHVTDVNQAGFGQRDDNDYCALVSVTLQETRIAFLYIKRTDASVYLPTSGGSADAMIGADLRTSPRAVVLQVAWDPTRVNVTGSIDGTPFAAQSASLPVGVSDLTPHVQLGLDCPGETPPVTLQADDVYVYAFP